MIKKVYVRFNKGNKELYIECEDSATAVKTVQQMVRHDSNRDPHTLKSYSSLNIIRTSESNINKHNLTTIEKVLSE